MKKDKQTKAEVISFLTLRRVIGALGMALPVILVVGSVIGCNCTEIQTSISNYYHTCMRNIFVGIMCATGLFLFAYKGYEQKDNIAGHLGCLFALGVALLPTSFKGEACNIQPYSQNPLVGYLHLVSALLFFSVLIYYSMVLFTKTTNKEQMGKQKKKRNNVYKWCGYIMISCIALIAVFMVIQKSKPSIAHFNLTFWFESVALWAFGISWLTKGEVLWKDAVTIEE